MVAIAAAMLSLMVLDRPTLASEGALEEMSSPSSIALLLIVRRVLLRTGFWSAWTVNLGVSVDQMDYLLSLSLSSLGACVTGGFRGDP